ncbi:MAG TPA: type II 3-dehydroquinate dehydratase [Bacteroidetes bacterium]|nr:type II 3-dehydroquinate dehydratase [Bacteroidota bacterium]HIL58951.1 type II 3-dehydroquinate dehydratase [Rhodothermales bacterium]
MSSRPAVLVLNGPNLNRLGTREPEVYGSVTLEDLERGLRQAFPELTLRFEQHNAEGALIDALHAADTVETAGIVFNAAAYTHTSIALRDAVASLSTPVVEVHISNVYARESFRHTSLLAPVAAGVIVGFGVKGYHLAVRYFADQA